MMNTASLGNFLISRAPPPQLYHLPVLAAWAGSFPSHRNPRPYHHLVWCSLDKALPPLLKTFSTAGLPAKDTAAAAIQATPGWASGSVDAATAPAILQEGGAVQHMVVLDAMALLYRAHFARRGARVQMVSPYGKDTAALFGFLRSLFLLLKGPPAPTHFVVVLDSGGVTYRHTIDEQYKAGREGCPAEVSRAANKLRALLPLLGVPVVKEVGWEADDLIGSIAVQAAEEGIQVAVVSPDKDFLQLLRPGLDLIRMGAGGTGGTDKYSTRYSCHDFVEEYGIEPPLYAHVLALAGDAADGISGLPGIGPKTAVALLKQFGSVQGALQGAAQVKGKVPRQSLQSPGAQDLALRCLQMTTIRTDLVGELASLQAPHGGWRLRGVGAEGAAAAQAEFEALGFRSLMKPLLQHLARVERCA